MLWLLHNLTITRQGSTPCHYHALSLKIIMKYTNYLPLIDISTNYKFVLWGGWYTENEDGTINLRNGRTCKKWETFPN
jgi:hypothetical protein